MAVPWPWKQPYGEKPATAPAGAAKPKAAVKKKAKT
jgi:hypothetical protein